MVSLLMLSIAVLAWPGFAMARSRTERRGEPSPAKSESAKSDSLAVAGALDVFAACLRSGLGVDAAAAATAPGAPEPLASALRWASERAALGADALAAWDGAAGDADTDALARLARRSARSGAPLSEAVAELAAERRARAEDDAAARAERAGVLVSGPLGLCFLPAFVCLGIVPVVVGLAGRVLGGGVL